MSDTSEFQTMFASAANDFMTKLREAYAMGRRDGRREERQSIERFLRTAPSEGVPAAPISDAGVALGGGRAPAGTIRPVVQQILLVEPGLTKADIARRAAVHGIAATSIANELQRNENVKKNKRWLYRRNKRNEWFLYQDDLPEKEGPAGADDARPAGSNRTMNGGDHDEATTLTPSGPA